MSGFSLNQTLYKVLYWINQLSYKLESFIVVLIVYPYNNKNNPKSNINTLAFSMIVLLAHSIMPF